jgi:hypothetical protein
MKHPKARHIVLPFRNPARSVDSIVVDELFCNEVAEMPMAIAELI